MNPNTISPILLIYAAPLYPTGQRQATALIEKLVPEQQFIHLPVPAFNRDHGAVREILNYLVKLHSFWKRLYQIRRTSPVPTIYINQGQSMNALLFTGLPVAQLVRQTRAKAILSLHGHWFASWNARSLKARLLRFLANQCRYCTVLGPHQVEALVALGVDKHRVCIFNNTCELTPIACGEIEQKHLVDTTPIRIIFLSNLIESKGYRIFVDCIEQISTQSHTRPIECYLCGDFLDTQYSKSVDSREDQAAWLESKLRTINKSEFVSIKWFGLVEGDQKETLLHRAHVLVFPSLIEAQPITLIEAMASGCVIVTSRVGEIAEMLPENAAFFVEPSTESVSTALSAVLSMQSSQRLEMATHAYGRFQEKYSNLIYADKWKKLIC